MNKEEYGPNDWCINCKRLAVNCKCPEEKEFM